MQPLGGVTWRSQRLARAADLDIYLLSNMEPVQDIKDGKNIKYKLVY